jgi:hypothetical protein
MTTNFTTRTHEKGNALFLILIAVVLFAALSFAITQSNRSGGNSNRETSLVSSTTVTQYSSSLRTGIMLMMLRNNMSTNQVLFIPPTEATYGGTDASFEVFHPDGGGVSFSTVDRATVNAVTTGVAITNPFRSSNWYFINNKVVENVGTAAGDIVALLTDVSLPVCQRINEQISGNTTIPTTAENLAALIGAGGTLSDAGTVLDAQQFYCVQPSASTSYVYYHVLAEQ